LIEVRQGKTTIIIVIVFPPSACRQDNSAGGWDYCRTWQPPELLEKGGLYYASTKAKDQGRLEDEEVEA
jgi:hypothetical protein